MVRACDSMYANVPKKKRPEGLAQKRSLYWDCRIKSEHYYTVQNFKKCYIISIIANILKD